MGETVRFLFLLFLFAVLLRSFVVAAFLFILMTIPLARLVATRYPDAEVPLRPTTDSASALASRRSRLIGVVTSRPHARAQRAARGRGRERP